MGQVDVNVADQNRGWQGQQGQEQAQHGQSGRTSAAGGRLDSVDEELAPATVAEVAAQTTSVIGSSAVDYYA
jgi:flagellar hook-length control protein FliK